MVCPAYTRFQWINGAVIILEKLIHRIQSEIGSQTIGEFYLAYFLRLPICLWCSWSLLIAFNHLRKVVFDIVSHFKFANDCIIVVVLCRRVRSCLWWRHSVSLSILLLSWFGSLPRVVRLENKFKSWKRQNTQTLNDVIDGKNQPLYRLLPPADRIQTIYEEVKVRIDI